MLGPDFMKRIYTWSMFPEDMLQIHSTRRLDPGKIAAAPAVATEPKENKPRRTRVRTRMATEQHGTKACLRTQIGPSHVLFRGFLLLPTTDPNAS